jgi:hypothetical protein
MKITISKKNSRTLLFVIASLIIPTVVHAVTYPFPDKAPSHYKDEAVMTVGDKIYLFYSGTDEIRKTINVNDVLTVYREFPPDFAVETREVGQVKVLSPLGDYYFDGEVIGGDVKAGDLAKKGKIACLVTSLKKNSHQSHLFVNEVYFAEVQQKRGEGL